MEHLLGITGLLFVGLVTLYLALRHPAIRIILLVAFALRAGAALFQFYVAPLPDGTADAVSFERTAWAWASGGLTGVLEQYCGPHSYFISFIIGIVYAITDRSPLLAQSLSVLFGMGGFFLSWKLAGEIWGGRAALKAAWVTALFPTLIMYSALTMREAYIVFFLLLGLLYTSRWARDKKLCTAVLALAAFLGATFFHGAMFVAVVAFAGIIMAREGLKLLALLARFRISLISISVLLILLVIAGSFIGFDRSVPKLGSISNMVDIERWVHISQTRLSGAASYPESIIPSSVRDLPGTILIQTAYFLFSPFPWNLTSPAYLLSFLDAILYFVLFVVIFQNFRNIWANPSARIVLLVILPLILAFTLGTGNFGTAIRHRAKFAAVFIVLAAPLLTGLVFFCRSRYNRTHQKIKISAS